MTCEQVLDRLPDFVLGTVTEIEAADIRRHLRGCGACRADAASMDQGVSLFASAAHDVAPPPELKDRVLSVLADEWRETPARPSQPRPSAVWLAVAAAVVLLAAAFTWGVTAQHSANRSSDRLAAISPYATQYQHFLATLGGKDVRVGTLQSRGGTSIQGTAVLYDSDVGQSWVLVLARQAGGPGVVNVTLTSANGLHPIKMFPLKFDARGEGSTWMVTSADISSYNHVTLTAPDGTVVAQATADHPPT